MNQNVKKAFQRTGLTAGIGGYHLPPTKLLKNSKKLNIWPHYLAPTSVGRIISEGVDETHITGANGRNISGQEGWISS
jgi:hypothetical protein